MKNTRIASWGIAIALVSASFPALALEVGALAGLNLSTESGDQPTGLTNSSGMGYMGGVFAALPVSLGVALEAGAFYVASKQEFGIGTTYNSAGGIGNSEVDYKSLQFPLLVRVTALPLISFGGGVYYAKALGKVHTKTSISGLATREADVDYSSAQVSSSDYGLVADARLRLPLAPLVGALFDARYLLGLKDTDTTGSSSKNRQIQLMLGISLDI